MSPESHLVIYYVRDDGEVVADTIDIKVEQCLANEVRDSTEYSYLGLLSFSHETLARTLYGCI